MRIWAGVLGVVLCVAASSVLAQPASLDGRVNKLEAEMRAVQRKVFPGGNSRFFEPEITAPEATPTTPDGVPASNPITDLTQRVGEMEKQLRTITGQTEANTYKLKQLETALEKMRGDTEFRLNALEGNPTGADAGLVAGGVAGSAAGSAAGAVSVETPSADAPPVSVVKPAPGTSVEAPEPAKAATAAEAWQTAYAEVVSKNWAATETRMAAYLIDWPRSTRIPQAQYWLGRSHAERKQHAQAADAYLKVYNNHPRSERAPDALLGLAGALIGIKNPGQACRVLGELDSVYGAQLGAGQKTEAKTLRSQAKCG